MLVCYRLSCLLLCFFFLMIRPPPRSTLTDTLFPYTTLFRSLPAGTPIRVVLGDSHAALFAHGIAEPGRVKATIGTGSSLMAANCRRSEEHTSELLSLMRISYAVFCLKKKKTYELVKRNDDSEASKIADQNRELKTYIDN